MAEDFALSELVIPGTYVRVQADALVGVGGISSGNIGIVGTAAQGVGDTELLSQYAEAQDAFGPYDAYDGGAGTNNLSRGLEVAYRNGAGPVFARALDPGDAGQDDYTAAFEELVKDDINILVAPELATDTALAVLGSIVESAENNGKDLIAVVGSDAADVDDILDQVPDNPRIIMTAPGIRAYDSVAQQDVDLDGTYGAAAMAGLLSTLVPQSSPTNKALPGVTKLTRRFSYGETVQLVNGRVSALEQRRGVRVVRGITTHDGAFKQITTRRITDFAKAGIRAASNPFIGRLNNERVRKALRGAIDGFLTTMLVDEALTAYELAVTATRQDEINGRAIVNAVLQPTFSIDYVAVTLVLQ